MPAERTVRAQSLPGTPLIKLNGAALEDSMYDALIEARAEHALGVPSRLVLRFADPDFEIIDGSNFKIGTEVDISFPKGAGQSASLVSVFKGEIVSIGVDQTEDSFEVMVEAQDKSHRFAYGSSIRTFKNITYSALISRLCQEVGLTAQVGSDALTGTTFKYLIQTGTTAEMFHKIADATGTEWSVVDNKVVFGDRSETVGAVLKAGDDLRRFRVRYTSSGFGTGVEVRGWDAATKQAVVGTDTTAVKGTFTGAATAAGLPSMRSGTNGFGAAKYVNGSATPLTKREADVMAKAFAIRQASQRMTARGEALGTPELKAGMFVQIANVGTKLSGKYYVTNVEHVFGTNEDFVTRFTAGGVQTSQIVDLLGSPSGVFGPWSGAALVVGIVTNNWDPDSKGRVKVKFPTLTDDDESEWARVLTFSGGGAFGVQFWPEINDEVLVGFEQSDLRRPIVLGALWGGVATPPVSVKGNLIDSSGKVMQRVIKSRTGHTIEFNDNTDKTKSSIVVKHKDGQTKLNLNDDKFEIWVKQDNPLHLKSGAAEIELKNGAIKITANTIEMKANQTATISAGQKLEEKATNIEINGTAGVKINANAKAEISGAAGVDVKGAIVKIN